MVKHGKFTIQLFPCVCVCACVCVCVCVCVCACVCVCVCVCVFSFCSGRVFSGSMSFVERMVSIRLRLQLALIFCSVAV